MQLVFGHDALVAQYVGMKTGRGYAGPLTSIGLTKDGMTLCGGVIFHNHTGANVDMGLALDVPLNRPFMRAIHHYVFVTANALRCTAVTKRGNKNYRKQLERFGFKYEAVSPQYFGPNKSDDGFRYVFYKNTVSKFL